MRPWAVLLLPVLACAVPEPTGFDGMLSVGTHALHTRIRGEGAPLVVIDAGIGGRAEEWYPIQEALSSTTSVLVYDRAGYGVSEAGPLPRDSGREADELMALLDGAGVPGPYVLVGHSLGGLNAQVFAERYPSRVAGLVLLDPPPLDWILGRGYPELRTMAMAMTEEWEQAAERLAGSGNPAERAEADFFRMIASEHREMFGRSAQLAAGVRSFGDVPLRVVASGVSNPMFGAAAGEFQEHWAAESRLLAGRSRRGAFRRADSSTHDLHRDAPEVVRAAIEAVVSEARR
jgi:pimeloyl-ACP methyl ester carboxylesterase